MPIDTFSKVFGPPNPPASPGLQFRTERWQERWAGIHAEIGAGWFCDGFLYLFGEGVDRLGACMEAWSFLIPPADSRMVLGRNAYGALLVLENTDDIENQSIHILDPFTVTYGKVPQATFLNMIARFLPSRQPSLLLDDRAYRAWLRENQLERIGLNDVVGIKVPRALGGELESENLQIENIFEYYKTTGPIYADAFATLKKSP